MFVPNGRRNDTDMLAVAAGIDTDGDGKVDEDTSYNVTADGRSGVRDVDDDGDGLVDEADIRDDDEDGQIDEDPLDGIDNDGDGSIDEDPEADSNSDGASGIAGFDDDDDGEIDEEDTTDDDEDGDEDDDPAEPIIFYLGEGTLMENHPVYGENELAGNVSEFRVQYVLGSNNEPHIDITLRLNRSSGSEINLNRQVHIENILQRQGMSL